MSALWLSSEANALVAATSKGARGKVEAPEMSAQDVAVCAGNGDVGTAAGDRRGRAGAGEALVPECGGGVVVVAAGAAVEVEMGAVNRDGLMGRGATGIVESTHEASAEREKV